VLQLLTSTLSMIAVGVTPAGTVLLPGDCHWQSFCCRSDRSNFGSTVTFFKGYVSHCPPMEKSVDT